ncbi:Conserved hypothetical protein [Xanthomonas translucens pv. translucens DSM 18974]|uniref:Uncharacterized protein n=1 Tax=Xanthomonas translucens pv. translucens DSM 18974 TaxID=1261556 RepID=A0A1C3TNL1_XANCT|nr:hypothetical protein BN444_00284 [Xanthomonas translucens pv. translucens DSM 18974]SCB04788.1 Conserved hypothetical protein [Xanthomonas translucens pv. translucens DSM 18974]
MNRGAPSPVSKRSGLLEVSTAGCSCIGRMSQPSKMWVRRFASSRWVASRFARPLGLQQTKFRFNGAIGLSAPTRRLTGILRTEPRAFSSTRRPEGQVRNGHARCVQEMNVLCSARATRRRVEWFQRRSIRRSLHHRLQRIDHAWLEKHACLIDRDLNLEHRGEYIALQVRQPACPVRLFRRKATNPRRRAPALHGLNARSCCCFCRKETSTRRRRCDSGFCRGCALRPLRWRGWRP